MSFEQENLADLLNRECDCAVTDLPVLRQRIERALQPTQSILESHAHLFCEVPVFLHARHVAEMRRVIEAIDAIAQTSAYHEAVLAAAPAIAHIDPRTAGVLMGFDFHIAPDGPKLIEINTNAGGALLNIAVRDAQRACCKAVGGNTDSEPDAAQLEHDIMSMFLREWSRARGTAPLQAIAIVDENPPRQYLYPEFQLAAKLFESRGIRALIAEPSDFELIDGSLYCHGVKVDLVYNRLTDFYLESPQTRVLRSAYEQNLAVITPHPHAHALYANKRNLVLLSDAAELARLGASPSVTELLTKTIPATREVGSGDEGWWRDRKSWFFKPRHGFGSRGAYRGDKLTRRVFAEFAKGEYLAQELTPPSERRRSVAGTREVFKIDVRCYVYAGKILLMAARVYQGQTTNFRTAGGGFAPVYVVGESSATPGACQP